MPFIAEKLRNRLRRSRKKFYDDVVEFKIFSGSDTLTDGTVQTYTGATGAITDAWDRPSIDPTRFTVIQKSIVVSGTFSWLPALDRRAVPAGMAEEGEAVFACSDEFYQVLSGERLYAVRDDQQLEVVRMTPARTTGETVIVLGRTRQDNIE